MIIDTYHHQQQPSATIVFVAQARMKRTYSVKQPQRTEDYPGNATPFLPKTVKRTVSEVLGEYAGCPPGAARRMMALNMPFAFYTLLHFLAARHDLVQHRDLTMVEFFSGVGNVKKAFLDAGYPALGFDVKVEPWGQPIMCPQGFMRATQQCRRAQLNSNRTQCF